MAFRMSARDFGARVAGLKGTNEEQTANDGLVQVKDGSTA
jgi:hypothetical protein